VRLIAAQYVKPFVKTNKNDYIDAEAIAEAVARPKMRFVPIKTDDQLDLQSLRRVARALGHASHGGPQPDAWTLAGARHHGAEGTKPYRGGLKTPTPSSPALGACCWRNSRSNWIK
jgi:hypothetical protein